MLSIRRLRGSETPRITQPTPCYFWNVASSLLLTEVAGDKVRPAEAGEDDRDEDPEADHAHDDGRPLRHGQVQLSPPGNLGEKTELPDMQ